MDYRDALNQIYSYTDYEKRGFAIYQPEFYDLDRVERLLALVGEPQQAFQSVHVAGTKGKGSTSAMIESVLRAAGYATGLYTSPHLHSFRERIQVNGALIPEAEVVRLVEKLLPQVDRVEGTTTFEVMTALALCWFADQGVEWAVLEVGLGGRLDATNVVIPAVSVITSISLDHVEILGDTLAKIAAEKAGIIKTGVPVVSAPQKPEAMEVIEATCRERGAPLVVAGRDWTWEAGAVSLDGQSFAVSHGPDTIPDLWLPLVGEPQVLNATVAIAVLSLLEAHGAHVSADSIRQGLRDVHWPGRFEVLARDPLVVVDSAHNGDSARKLVQTLKATCRYERLIMVLGASPDHATPELLEALLSPAHRAITTQADHPRAADPVWLQARAEELGYSVDTSATVKEALEMALSWAGPADLICFAGSVFVVGGAQEAWLLRQGLPLPPRDPV